MELILFYFITVIILLASYFYKYLYEIYFKKKNFFYQFK